MHNSTKWLIGLVAALVIVNIGLLAFTWFSKDDRQGPPEPGDARSFLVKTLGLNSRQQAQFDSLRKTHFAEVNQQRREMRKLKHDLFEQLKDEHANPDQMAARIGALQTRIELNTFRHFAALRKICNEEQKKKFDNTIQEVLRSMGRRQGPPRGDGAPPPHGGDAPPPPDGPGPDGSFKK